jgi:hypothetical protein
VYPFRVTRFAPNGDVFPWPMPVGNVLKSQFQEIGCGGVLLDRLLGLPVRERGPLRVQSRVVAQS